jgi:hypothetical protein
MPRKGGKGINASFQDAMPLRRSGGGKLRTTLGKGASTASHHRH